MDFLTVPEAAAQRRSIRKYTDETIPEETLREIIRVAGLAPSPWNLQPWRLVVVREPELKAKLMAAAYGQPQVGRSQATFVLWSDMHDVIANVEDTVHPGMPDPQKVAQSIRDNFGKYSPEDLEQWGNSISYIFLGYLMLSVQAFGYSSSPMLGFDPAQVKELLGLPETARVPALLSIGKAAEEGFTHHRHPLERFVRFE